MVYLLLSDIDRNLLLLLNPVHISCTSKVLWVDKLRVLPRACLIDKETNVYTSLYDPGYRGYRIKHVYFKVPTDEDEEGLARFVDE
jgi:hypothetical protein